jgi:hypothetical protein
MLTIIKKGLRESFVSNDSRKPFLIAFLPLISHHFLFSLLSKLLNEMLLA